MKEFFSGYSRGEIMGAVVEAVGWLFLLFVVFVIVLGVTP